MHEIVISCNISYQIPASAIMNTYFYYLEKKYDNKQNTAHHTLFTTTFCVHKT